MRIRTSPKPEALDKSKAPRKRWSLRRIAGWFVTAVAALACVGILGPWIWVSLASRERITTAENAPTRPVTLVLGAGVQPNGEPTPFLADRLDTAKELLDSRKTQVLLVSGDNRTHGYDEPTSMRNYLIAKGVEPSRVIADFAGRDTYDSCARAKRIFGVDNLLVVSQAYHLPRALAICIQLGVDAIGVGTWQGKRYASERWATGTAREKLANMKAVVDVVSKRDPVLGKPENSVTEALGSGKK